MEGKGWRAWVFNLDHVLRSTIQSRAGDVRIEGMAGFMVQPYLKLLEVKLSVARRDAALLVAKDGLAAPIANASHLRFKF